MKNQHSDSTVVRDMNNQVSQSASLLKKNINYLYNLLCDGSVSNNFTRLSAMIEFIVLPGFGLHTVEAEPNVKNNLELAALLSICEQQMNILLRDLSCRDPKMGNWVHGVFKKYAEHLRTQILTNSPFNKALVNSQQKF